MAKKKRASKKTSGAKSKAARAKRASPRKKSSPKQKPTGGGRRKAVAIAGGDGRVVTKAFTTLVTRLRDAYLSSPKTVKEEEEADLARQFQALPLGIVQFLWFFLHPEGRVVQFGLLDEAITGEYTQDYYLCYGLRIGSHRYPELESLLPSRPEGGTECAVCAGKGRIGEGEDAACGICWGRGWQPAGFEELVERTAAALRHAGEERETIAAAARTFFASGLAIGFDPPLLCTAFDRATRFAGFDDAEGERRIRISGTVASEYFPEGWPYWTEQQ